MLTHGGLAVTLYGCLASRRRESHTILLLLWHCSYDATCCVSVSLYVYVCLSINVAHVYVVVVVVVIVVVVIIVVVGKEGRMRRRPV